MELIWDGSLGMDRYPHSTQTLWKYILKYRIELRQGHSSKEEENSVVSSTVDTSNTWLLSSWNMASPN